MFVVEGNTAHKQTVQVKGEREGRLFLDTALAPGSKIVTEGRALLSDNDKVTATLVNPSAAPPAAAAPVGSTSAKRSAE